MEEIIGRLKQLFLDFGTQIGDFLPNLLTAIFLMIIGWVLAKIIKFIIVRIARALNLDKLMDKVKEVDMFAGITIKLSDLLGKLGFWSVMLIFLTVTSEFLGINSITEGIGSAISYVPNLLSAIVFFVIGVFVAHLIRKIIETATDSMDLAAGKFISGAIFYFLVIMIAITSINQAGIETDIITDNLKILLGGLILAFVIGYGLSSKDIMSNLLASFYSKGKFEVGQTIQFKDKKGVISSIDSTSVTLKADGKKIVIPLAKLVQEEVEIHNS